MFKRLIALIMGALAILSILFFLKYRDTKIVQPEKLITPVKIVETPSTNAAAAPYALYAALEKLREAYNYNIGTPTDEKLKQYFNTTLTPKNYKKYFEQKIKLSDIPGISTNPFTEKELFAAWVTKENKESIIDRMMDMGFGKFTQYVDVGRIVSILEVLMKWKKEGEKTKLADENDKLYDAVEISKHFVGYTTENGKEILELETKGPDKVYITMTDDVPASNIEILRQIKDIKNKEWKKDPTYKKAIFPMVDFESEPDISYFANFDPIEKAFMKVIFKMNEKGAVAKAAVVILPTAFREMKILTINKPFVLWAEREGLDLPIIAIYCDQKHWKNPGKLF